MDIEYDAIKADANLRKHGISFTEARAVFSDLQALAMEDRLSSYHSDEPRWLILGMGSKHRLLVVSYTYRNEAIRIISARRASKSEAVHYA